VTRRRWLLLGALVAVLVLVALVANRDSRERQQQRRREAQERALEEYERKPGAPDFLVALDRTPHDGFRAFQDVEADDAKYRGKVFRFVGRASSLRLVEDNARAELVLRDHADSATFHLHYITSSARLEAMQREGGLLEAPVCDEANGDLVIVDGIFESRAVFTHCYIRWKVKGDDWPAALREAKKGLDLDKINRP
jgi:hypothetical protein